MNQQLPGGTPSGPTLLIAATVIDGDATRPVIRPGAVLVDGDRIRSVGNPADYGSFPVARIDFGDATILPGLIDCHVHLTMPGDGTRYEPATARSMEARHATASANARAHLLAGVTTIRDLGSHADLLGWRDGLDAREPAPTLLLYTSPLTAPAGHMHLYGGECQGTDQVAAQAERNLSRGADGLKIVGSGGGTLGTHPHIPAFTTDEMRAAVAVARRHGRLVTAHALAAEAVQRAADAGVDGIEHVGYLTPDRTEVFDPRTAAAVIDRGIHVGSTLSVNHQFLDLPTVDPEARELERAGLQAYLDNATEFHRLGGRLVAGSDAGWQITPFGDFAAEVEFLTRAGMRNLEAIEAATWRAASYLGLFGVGRVHHGYQADLLVVEGDATQQIGALKLVRAVLKAGSRVV